MKTIMLDVDGVLLDWNLGLIKYMRDLGYKIPDQWWDQIVHEVEWLEQFGFTAQEYRRYVEGFCRSLEIAYLEPNGDAVRAVRDMRDDGVRMIICTMLGTNHRQTAARIFNLQNVFGSVFEAYHFVDYRDYREPGFNLHETKAKLLMREYGTRIDAIVDDSATIIDQFAEQYPTAQRILKHNAHDLRGERQCSFHQKVTSLSELKLYI